MNPHESTQRVAAAKRVDGMPWTARRRTLVSGLILFHVLAVFIAPFASPPPSSDIAQACGRMLQPYLQAVAIDNGYRFFAPNPGPSHLVRYEVDLADGTRVTGRFPDLEQHWPRLLYHRHFMLAESLFNLAMPVAELPPAGFASDEQRQLYDEERSRADALRYSVARYLLRRYPDAQRLRLFALEHEIPTPWDLQDGLKLDDPQLFAERTLGVFTPADIEQYLQSLNDNDS
jgi:hypothetical protein